LIQTAAPSTNRADVYRVSIAFLGFIFIGMPPAVLGIATPYIATEFGLTLDTIGILLVTYTISYFIISSITGRLLARFGAAKLLIASAILPALGLIGYGLAPSWGAIIALSFVVAAGAGLIDTGMNIFFAAHYGPRLMNWLHACYGIGATIGPLMITAILNVGGVWRTAYLGVATFFGILTVLFLLTRGYWDDTNMMASGDDDAKGMPASATLRLPLVWVGILIFFLLAGLESVPGQWSFALFTTERGVTEATAGLWVSIYWASFTVSRIIFGIIVSWVNPRNLVWACVLGSVVGGLLYAWNPGNTVGFIGLAVSGFFIAPLFALLITNTQKLLGSAHAPNAISFQVAAASAGFGIVPGIAGVLGERGGLETIPPFYIILAVLLVVLYGLSLSPRLAFRRESSTG
jgi:fucose permease